MIPPTQSYVLLDGLPLNTSFKQYPIGSNQYRHMFKCKQMNTRGERAARKLEKTRPEPESIFTGFGFGLSGLENPGRAGFGRTFYRV